MARLEQDCTQTMSYRWQYTKAMAGLIDERLSKAFAGGNSLWASGYLSIHV